MVGGSGPQVGGLRYGAVGFVKVGSQSRYLTAAPQIADQAKGGAEAELVKGVAGV